MKVENKADFFKWWENLFPLCKIEEVSNEIIVKEFEKSGEGEINLKFKNRFSDKKFLVNLKMDSNFNLKCISKTKNCDGVILLVDLEDKIIKVFLIELKKTLTDKIEDSNLQIQYAYMFVNSLLFVECGFKMEYIVILGYSNLNKQNLLNNDLKNKFIQSLYFSIIKENNYPIKHPFCEFKTFDLKLVKFYETLEIE